MTVKPLRKDIKRYQMFPDNLSNFAAKNKTKGEWT